MRRKIIVAAVGGGMALAVFGSAALVLSLAFFPPRARADVSNLQASPASACAVDLSWVKTGAVGSFELWRSTVDSFYPSPPSPTVTQIILNDEALTARHEENLAPGTHYYYWMRSWTRDDAKGKNSGWSNVADLQLAALTAPAKVTGLQVMGVSGGQQAHLTWTSGDLSSESSGFDIYRADEKVAGGGTFGDDYVKIGTAPYDERTFRDGWDAASFLNPAKAYRYKVVAFNTDVGCGTARAEAAASNEVTMPATPTNLKASFIYDPNTANRVTATWVQSGTTWNYFEVWRKVNNSNSTFSARVNTLPTAAAPYEDTGVAENNLYTYEVRACTIGGGCSGFSNESGATVASAPQGFVATIVTVSAATAAVNLSWKNTFPDRDYYLERKDDAGAFAPIKTITSVADPLAKMQTTDTVNLGKVYTYRVYAKFGAQPTKYYSDEATVSTVSLQNVKGWAWGGNGLGWTRLSNNSVKSSWGDATQADDSITYSVYLERDTELLRGYAWNPYGGWLAFSKDELGKNCPLSGACEARVSMADGTVTGWAKFVGDTAADGTALGLDRWVSLSPASGGGTGYGLYYATTTESGAEVGVLRGFAWGGDVVGWMSFGGPILLKVEPTDTPAGGSGAAVKLTWRNPMNYTGVEVRISDSRDVDCEGSTITDQSKCPYIIKPVTNPSKLTQGLRDEVVDGLKANTQYGFYLRGFPE